jgi:hypothetical protein
MAIKINGNTVIDDSQNFTSTGNVSATGNITGGNINGTVSGNISAAGVIGGVQYKDASGFLASSANAFYDVGNLALYGHKVMCGVLVVLAPQNPCFQLVMPLL